VAAKKTAGVLGDDLALNAEQVTGVQADRELPVVWAVAKGSFVNKLILIPLALAISEWVPWMVTPLLVIGGSFLCYEGFEKVWEKFFHKKAHKNDAPGMSSTATPMEVSEYERIKIKGAVRTDFILSAEIIVITLGTVATEALLQRVLTLSSIGTLMTVGVYGLVAAIVKMDDLGLYLIKGSSLVSKKIGRGLLVFAPQLMKFLGIAGTIAMFLVGGGIITHAWPAVHHWQESLSFPLPTCIDLTFGLIVGGVIVALTHLMKTVNPFTKKKMSKTQ
jgi:predicted DNA repair protein MutK